MTTAIAVLITMIVSNKRRGRRSVTADSWRERIEKARDSLYFLLISFAVRDTFSNTLMSARESERADERQTNPALLIPLIQPLPLKKNHPSPLLTLPPSQTGKPLLNNIIAYLILTVTSTKGEKSLIESLERALSPLTAHCVCVGG